MEEGLGRCQSVDLMKQKGLVSLETDGDGGGETVND